MIWYAAFQLRFLKIGKLFGNKQNWKLSLIKDIASIVSIDENFCNIGRQKFKNTNKILQNVCVVSAEILLEFLDFCL